MDQKLRIWLDTLHGLCARNGAVEVACLDLDRHDAEPGSPHLPPTYRMRLLEVDDDGAMTLERPAGLDPAIDPAKSELVEVLAIDGMQRWRGICEVAGTLHYKLNDTTRVNAVQVRPALEVQTGQRRRVFRVDASCYEVRLVLLRSTIRDRNEPLPTESDVKAALINISGGGIGVSVRMTDKIMRDVRHRRRYRCVIYLPTDDEPVDANARLIHMHTRNGRDAYLGMEFEFASEIDRERAEDRIVHFTTMVQREQIRRQKRA